MLFCFLGIGVVEFVCEVMFLFELFGCIVYVLLLLVVGGCFEKGEVLLWLDKCDY